MAARAHPLGVGHRPRQGAGERVPQPRASQIAGARSQSRRSSPAGTAPENPPETQPPATARIRRSSRRRRPAPPCSCRWRNCRSISPRPCSTTRPTSPTTSKLLRATLFGGDPRRQEDLPLMDTSALKTFAQEARRALRDQVTAKLDLVLAQGSAARREAPGAVAKLETAIGDASRDQVVEKVAYTWFNRFSALRFMDANGYTGVARALAARGRDAAGDPVGGDGGRHWRGGRRQRPPTRCGRCSTGARPRAIRRAKPIACSSSPPATTGTARCRSCSSRSPTNRTADARRSAVGFERAGKLRAVMTEEACRGRRDHRLALPVLHFGEEGRGFRGAEEERQDHAGKHPRRHAAFHAALDRPLSRRELARAAMAAEPPAIEAGRADGLLHRAGRAGDGFSARLPPRRDPHLRSGLRLGAHADLCLRPAARDL